MKRFVDSARFADPWYSELPPAMKVAWELMWSQCDQAGVWKPNTKLADFMIGSKVDWKAFKERCGDRVVELKTGWWIVDYVRFQCGELSADCRAHIPVVKLLREHQLLKSDSLSIVYPMTTHSHKEQEQEEEMEQDKEQEKPDRGAGGRSDNLPTKPKSKLVADLFKRQHTTPWNDREVAAFRKIENQTQEDFDLVADYYLHSGSEYLRHDLGTFLNNFTGEVDRARQWKSGKLNGKSSHRHGALRPEDQPKITRFPG